MPALFLALIAAALATLAGREAVRVARLSRATGAGGGLLVAVWLAAIGSSAFAAWFGSTLAQELPASAKAMLVAFALALGAGEILLLRPPPEPREPTRSFGAALLVLLAAQLTDSARLLILALAASTGAPLLAGAGGALGSGVVLTAAWALDAEWESKLPLRALRWSVAAAMLLAAILVGLNARGLLG